MLNVSDNDGFFIRGFILSSFPNKPHDHWKTKLIRISDEEALYYSYDPKNSCTYVESNNYYVLACGTMMDVEKYIMNQSIIVNMLLEKLEKSEFLFYNYIDVICGRYLIIYGMVGDYPKIVQDATGMRSVYYAERKLIVASHVELVQMHANEDESPLWEEYKNNNRNIENNNIGLPGNTTPYWNIKALIPNHVLDTKILKQIRFWPRHSIVTMDLDTICNEALICFRKQAEKLIREYKHICISLTGGIDSNISAKAFEPSACSVEFFTYYDPEESIKGANTHADAKYAESYCKKHNYKYHKLILNDIPSEERLEICCKNTWQRHITRAIDSYCDFFSPDYIHIRSNLLEIVRTRGTYTGNYITNNPETYYIYKYKHCNRELFYNAIAEFWEEADFKDLYDYDFSDIFYWEERCAMWHGGSVLLESDLAFETYTLFNYRKFFDQMLSVNKSFINTNRIYEIAMKKGEKNFESTKKNY